MWIPKRLIINNFRSFYGENVFEFRNGETYLLQGVNNSDNGVKSNGSGKSSIREALCYVLGLPTYSDTLSDLINFESDFMEVVFEAENNLLNQKLIIKRRTPIKGSSVLEIEINKISQKDKFSTVPEGDKFILKILGISSKDLLNHFIISKEKFVSFFSSSDNDKKELINRFSGADKIEGIESLIKIDLNNLQKELNSINDSINKINGKIELLDEEKTKLLSGDNTKNEVILLLNEKLNTIKDEISLHEKSILSNNTSISLLNGKQKDLNSELSNLEKDLNSVDITAIELQKKEIKKEILELESAISEMNVFLSGIVTCPKCSTEFNPSDKEDMDIKEVEKLMNSFVEKKEKLYKKSSDLEINIEKLQEKRKNLSISIKEKNTEILNTTNLINKHLNEVKRLKNEISISEKKVTSLNEGIEETKNKNIKDKENELIKDIEEYNTSLNELKERYEAKKQEIANVEIWIFRFTKFKSHLANKFLSTIQGYSNLYLEKMKTNLGLKIEGYKQNKDGTIREKITPIVLRNGLVERSGSYKIYSGGERKKVDIAPTLACRNLINISSETGGLDLFFIDEILEGFDSLSIENFAESVQNLGVTSIITSHVQHESNFSNIITVEKNNYISNIKYN